MLYRPFELLRWPMAQVLILFIYPRKTFLIICYVNNCIFKCDNVSNLNKNKMTLLFSTINYINKKSINPNIHPCKIFFFPICDMFKAGGSGSSYDCFMK